ncbi:Nudix hydrolase 11 [Hondaea fermentalgiana]|uniref:Nudix hydrolase 11 n=1 Tax=Hondaea fermentalgiana TaxID=2315210 RepID=A0A2R5GGE7_9STRA|nr:Nudix hydrolase 11 [Hondaea fermentalgiana]|eukprot:GBG29957.1 Nudix hydrolase 11 [Hondaea fermentalgiana]
MRVAELRELLGRATLLPGSKRACVALLLRVAPKARSAKPELQQQLSAGAAPDEDSGGLAGEGRAAHARKVFAAADVRDLEAFFILRASNDDDRWGGQVGLPGGRQNAGEEDRATAAREVFEEVGLVLPELDKSLLPNPRKNSPFAFVGRIHDRKVLQGKNALIVCSFVYLQVTDETLTLMPEPSEVGACGWSPLDMFLEDDVAQPLSFSVGDMGFPKENPKAFKLMQLLRLDRMFFTMVPLRVDPLYISAEVDTRTGHAQPASPSLTPPEDEQAVRQAFYLWGMTLGIVNDLLVDMSGIRTERIGVTDRILPGFKVEKLFGSKAHNFLLHSLRRGYHMAFDEPMPWSMYMRTYPMLVLALTSATPVILGTSFLSRL